MESEYSSVTPVSEAFSLSSFESSTLPMLRGWLQKKSPSLFKHWQSRFFVLYNKRLYYYSTDACARLKGVLNFDQVSVDVQLRPINAPTQLILTPLGHKRVFHLKAAAADLAAWAVAIHTHILASVGKAKDLVRPTLEGPFWRFDAISDWSFRNTACSGDLLLFRSRSVAASLQRCVTRCSYDHVALVLRYSTGDLALLEATGPYGVTVMLYDDFFYHGWIKHYDRVVLRHLEVVRNLQFMQNLEKFVHDTLGKRYKLNPRKLLKQKVREPGTEDHFFCSELVASAYKKLGLLAAEVSACKFWPKDFSEEASLELTGGTLSPEMPIDYRLTN